MTSTCDRVERREKEYLNITGTFTKSRKISVSENLEQKIYGLFIRLHNFH